LKNKLQLICCLCVNLEKCEISFQMVSIIWNSILKYFFLGMLCVQDHKISTWDQENF
jgi:hypothetical protein